MVIAERIGVIHIPLFPLVVHGLATTACAATSAKHSITSCSTIAAQHGIRVGMKERVAQSVCPEIVMVQRDHEKETRWFAELLDALAAFAPHVGMVTLGTAALPFCELARYFEDEEYVLRELHIIVHTTFDALGDPSTPRYGIGVARGVFAAMLAAQQACKTSRNIYVVPEADTMNFLDAHSITALQSFVSLNVDVLRRLGIKTLADLRSRDDVAVRDRFGSDAITAKKLCEGKDVFPVREWQSEPDCGVEKRFEEPLLLREQIVFGVRTLFRMLQDELHHRHLTCTTIIVSAKNSYGDSFEQTFSSPSLLHEAELAGRVQEQLDVWIRSQSSQSSHAPSRTNDVEAPAGVSAIRLQPRHLFPELDVPLQLWGVPVAEAERIQKVVARITALFPSHTSVVMRAKVQAERCEQRRVQFESWQKNGCSGDVSGSVQRVAQDAEPPPFPGHIPAPHPATLYRTPFRVEVFDAENNIVQVCASGELSGAPAVLVWQLRRNAEQIVAWAGPWLIEERWWQRDAHCRLAHFQFLTDFHHAYLLRVEQQLWYVQGKYD